MKRTWKSSSQDSSQTTNLGDKNVNFHSDGIPETQKIKDISIKSYGCCSSSSADVHCGDII